MSEEVFKSLSESLNEAGEILRGETIGHREFVRQISPVQRSTKALAICAVSDDEDLIRGKLYRVKILASGKITVKDESGEAVLCDPSDFVLVKFQPAVARRIGKILDGVAA